MRRPLLVLGFLALIGFALAYYSLPFLQLPLAVHWGLSSEADGFSATKDHIFFVPVLMIGTAILFWAVPKLEVNKQNFKASEDRYWTTALMVQLFLLILLGAMILYNTGFVFPMTRMIFGLIGLMIAGIGTMLPKIKRMFFFGIRTPWPLSHDTVWEQTHVFGQKAFWAGGALFVVSALFTGPFSVAAVVLGFVCLLSPIAYSWIIYSKRPKPQTIN